MSDLRKPLPIEPTPAMASAGMRVIASLPDDAGWPDLARAACAVWRAMAVAAELETKGTE